MEIVVAFGSTRLWNDFTLFIPVLSSVINYALSVNLLHFNN